MVSIANRARDMRSDVGILLFNSSHFSSWKVRKNRFKWYIGHMPGSTALYWTGDAITPLAVWQSRNGIFGYACTSERWRLQAVFDKGTSNFQLTYDDRALQFSYFCRLNKCTFQTLLKTLAFFIAGGSDEDALPFRKYKRLFAFHLLSTLYRGG